MKFEQVIMVGAGGIGSNLAEPLARMLAYHENGTKNFVIVDGDDYEAKNQNRQLFDPEFLDKNKAEALASRLRKALSNPETGEEYPVKHHPAYVNKDKFKELLSEFAKPETPLLVLSVVDNAATRKAMIEALDEEKYQNFVFLSGGNGEEIGQALAYVKLLGEKGTCHPFDKYDNIKYPDDHIPGDPGCLDDAVDTPQLLVANGGASLALQWLVQALLDNKEWYEEVHFDIRTMKIAPQGDPITVPEAYLEYEKTGELPGDGDDVQADDDDAQSEETVEQTVSA